MADINVERKGPSIWPWIIGLIVLALLIWALAEMLGDDDDADTAPLVTDTTALIAEPTAPAAGTPAPGAVAAAVPPAVEEYMSTCVQGASPTDMGLQHQYTADCIQRLSGSIDAVINRPEVINANVQQRLDNFRQQAERLRASDPQATTHSNLVRQTFVSAADLLNTVQDERYASATDLDTRATGVRQAAEAVQATTPLLNQRDAVQRFFQEAGETLRMMATTPAT
jgi:hypothetical protein